MILRPSRHTPSVGDLFVLNMLGSRWIVGRVVRTDAKGFGSHSRLLYFYDLAIDDPLSIRTPLEPRLLIAPVMTNDRGWSKGYYAHLLNVPMRSEELLPRHVFENDLVPLHDQRRFQDEYGNSVAAPEPGPNASYIEAKAWSRPWKPSRLPGVPCGWVGLWNFQAIDSWLSWALGVKDKEGVLPAS